VEAMLKGAANPQTGKLAAVAGVVLLLFAAIAVVLQLKEALNTIWEVETAREATWTGYVRTYLVSFAGILGLGFLLAVSLVINAALAAAASWFGTLPEEVIAWETINFSISLVVLALLFALLFKWFPDTEVRWRDVIPGALATALLFNIGKLAIAWYVGRQALESTYGAAASIVIVLIWVYYSAQILLLGAELTHAYANRRRPLS
jgi:membrane protein